MRRWVRTPIPPCVAPSGGSGHVHPRWLAPPWAGVGGGVERSGAPWRPRAPLPVTPVHDGFASARPRPFALSCRSLRPPAPTPSRRAGGRQPGEAGGAHQRRPPDGTALGRRVTLALASFVTGLGGRTRPVASWLPAAGQLFALGLGVQAPTPHPHRPGRRYRQEPAPQEGLERRRLVRSCDWPPLGLARSSYRNTTAGPHTRPTAGWRAGLRAGSGPGRPTPRARAPSAPGCAHATSRGPACAAESPCAAGAGPPAARACHTPPPGGGRPAVCPETPP